MRAVRISALVVVGLACLELAGLQLARRSLIAWLLGAGPDAGTLLLIACLAAVTGIAAGWLESRRGRARWRPVALVLSLAFAAGLYAQLQLGARLQSDGFYYFSYLRSLWFDRDVDFTNDYKLLGLTAPQHQFLYTPTPTGHAQTAWAIGPALAWSPFFAIGDGVARTLHARGADVAIDGTSFPYRQAVCIAGLFYGLLGAWCCWRLACLYFPSGLAAAATALTIGGSFLLWYLVREPSMSHAPSMAAVAGFVWAWAATRSNRSLRAWTLLGLLAGLMMAVRWQNGLFLLLPGLDLLDLARLPQRSAMLPRAGAFAAAATLGFLPQMLAWQAIYGRPLAMSPISPRLLWNQPQLLDILWSSRNGLFALSPVIYAGALGLILLARTHRRLGLSALVIFGLMVYLNASVEDWWGGAGFGGRRFDSLIPLFVLGTAAVVAAVRRLVATRPAPVVWTALAGLVLWNLTFMDLAAGGAFRIGQPLDFSQVAGGQAATLERWTGHPFSWPVNLLYAARHGVAPWRYDLLRPNRFLADPSRPYGRVDLGTSDEWMLGDGWHGPEADGSLSFRWTGQEAHLLLPLDHAAPLLVQVHLRPFDYGGAAPQQLTVVVNGQRHGPLALESGWHRVEVPTDATSWQAGVNRLELQFSRVDRPVDRGLGGDARWLSAAVDYVRVEVPDPSGNP